MLLAYTSTLANTLLGVAFGEGIVVHFWTAALRGVPVSLVLRRSERKNDVTFLPTPYSTYRVVTLLRLTIRTRTDADEQPALQLGRRDILARRG